MVRARLKAATSFVTSTRICEWFHRTALNEFYHVTFRKKVYRSTDEWVSCMYGSRNIMAHGI
jgi:hypothetical protein